MAFDEKLTEAFFQFSELGVRVIEVTAGHKQRCINEGFSAATAEQMSIAFHQFMISAILNEMFNTARRQAP